jgi:hypothetical protein
MGWRISIPNGILRAVEVCMLIAGVATLALSRLPQPLPAL